ncbi:MAG: AlpA family transcriptional regulator [Deltaproteobacteria bacterium HGW-Deltaproteobacteria-4]|nr:MAG: AlpA family transcriptional regulator [Deltaproteobacteria bacterium HGW-Deltaproteobacteria-4]
MSEKKKKDVEIVLVSGEQFFTKRQVIAITSRSATSLHRDVKAQRFPAPKSLGPLRIGWLKSDINEWLNSRPLVSTKK